ncbi:MAG: gpW family head-tail joining protein [Amaricoccus sp.]
MPELPDPCDEAQALRDAIRDLAMGRSVVRVRFGEDDVTYRSADMAALRQLLADAEARCAEAQGRRRRFAMGARFRAY